ncbi:MAG: TRAP transporter small permease subunit [Chloroflexota bacterium]
MVLKPKYWLHIIDIISEWSGKIISFAIILIIGYVIYGIIVRYVFRGMFSHLSIAQRIFTAYVVLGAAWAFQNKAFINVDIFTRRLSVRKRAIIDSFTFILFLVFTLALLKYTSDVALSSLPKTRFSLQLFDPARWPTTLIIPVGVLLLVLQGLAKFVRDLIAAITGEETT